MYCFVECRNVIPSMIAFKIVSTHSRSGCLDSPCSTSRRGETVKTNILLMRYLFNFDRLCKALPVSEKRRRSYMDHFILSKSVLHNWPPFWCSTVLLVIAVVTQGATLFRRLFECLNIWTPSVITNNLLNPHSWYSGLTSRSADTNF